MSTIKSNTVALATLGCKLNQAETEQIAQSFASAGFSIVEFGSRANVYVVNTCAVTHIADRKSRQLIRQARRLNPDALVVVSGCYANVSPREIYATDSGEAADSGGLLVVPNEEKSSLVDIVASKLGVRDEEEAEGNTYPIGEISSSAKRTRAFVKIHDGCNQFCAYCIVPYARGRARSTPVSTIVKSINDLHAAGFKEVVLTGVHIGAYGKDLREEGGPNLEALIRAVLDNTSIPRIRLSSIEPQDFTRAMLEMWPSPRLCRHLHLPLQSGCDSVLRRMRRPYDVDQYRRIVDLARSRIPGVAVTTDIIVGFPGETDEEFRLTYDFAEEIGFSGIHVFKYSARQGTSAAELPNQVPHAVKKVRSEALIALAQKSGRQFASTFVGKTLDVLYESQAGDSPELACEGLSDNYLRVVSPCSVDVLNEIVPSTVVTLSGEKLIARVNR